MSWPVDASQLFDAEEGRLNPPMATATGQQTEKPPRSYAAPENHDKMRAYYASIARLLFLETMRQVSTT